MRLSLRIAGPLALLAALALAVSAGLLAGATAGPREAGVRADRVLAVAARLAAVREAQRMVTGLALAGLGKAPARGGTAAAARGAQALVYEGVATALSGAEAMRRLAAGQSYEASVDRLTAEVARWRDHVEQVVHADPAGTHAPSEALAALAAQGHVVERLADDVAGHLEPYGRADPRREAALRGGALAVIGVVLAALGLCWTALRFSRRLARDMARLPADLQGLVRGDRSGTLPAEAREDEMGAMARELRAFGERMRQLTQSRAEMERMALTDPLTGLPNRRGLYDFMAGAGGQGGWGERGTVAVVHIDLDHFKAVNDTYGHEAGDSVLREATRRMASVIRDTDILARLGGDEFVIVAQGLTSQGSLERLSERLIRQFDPPIAFRDRTLHVTASLGAVLGGRRGEVPDPKRLLISADIALGHAKTSGRNRWSIFTSEMARAARRRQEQADEIRGAIERGEFHLWFRPVLDLRSGKAVALDLVPRWLHPERGVQRTDGFIDAAEAHNLTRSMLMPALERALRQIGEWRGAGAAVPPLHVGMSRTMLLAPDVVDRLCWLLDETHIQPDQIAIEISERFCSGRGVEAVFANLRRFSDLGAGLVIEDFGSVDAALGTITRLGASAIKLDVTRTWGLLGSEDDLADTGTDLQALLPGILGIGESLGVTVLAKRVARQADLDRLRARGFCVMQGDAVARAMDPAATARWLGAGAAPGKVRLAAG